jgi:hypothetical protein
MNEEVKKELAQLKEEFNRLKASATIPYEIEQALRTRLIISAVKATVKIDNVTDAAPTAAELNTAFGTAASLGSGFIGILDDNNAETRVWLCVVIGSSWFFEALTKAA